MSSSTRRLLPLAALIAIGIAAILLVLAQPELLPPDPLIGSWASNFGYSDQVYRNGIDRSDTGLVLSHIRPIDDPELNLGHAGGIGFDDMGRLIGTLYIPKDTMLPLAADTMRLFRYDPVTQQVVDLGEILSAQEDLGVLTMAHDGRIYVIIKPVQPADDVRLKMFDLGTRQIKDLGTIAREADYFSLVATRDGHVYGAAGAHLFMYDPTADRIIDLGTPFRSNHPIRSLTLDRGEQLLYATAGPALEGWLFEYDLTNHTAITLTNDIWWYSGVIQGSDDKLYGLTAQHVRELIAYDPVSKMLKNLGTPSRQVTTSYTDIWTMASGPDGSIYGTASSIPGEGFLFRYSPATEEMASLYPLGDHYNTTPLVAPDGRIYLSIDGHLSVYDSDVYGAQGTGTTSDIVPEVLTTEYIVLGDRSTYVPTLVWGNDGSLYGITSRVWQPGRSWLFRYDPARPDTIAFVDKVPMHKEWPSGASALVADRQGRLIASSNHDLITYDPATQTAVSFTVPISGLWYISALTIDLAGRVYGAAVPGRVNPPSLFVYDPASGTFADLGAPIQAANRIFALTVAPDGRIYGGGIWQTDSGNMPYLGGHDIMFVYDPANDSIKPVGPRGHGDTEIRALLATSDGKIYIGLGEQFGFEGQFQVYDSATDRLTDLPLPTHGSVVALTRAANGLIYGSTATPQGQGYLFAYDPRKPDQPPKLIGTMSRSGFAALTSGPDDTLYGATGAFNSYYNEPVALTTIHTSCPHGVIGSWDRLTWEADMPPGTDIKVDILDPYDSAKPLLSGVQNGALLQSIDARQHPAIKLRATLTTDDPNVTPILSDWRVTYDFRCTTQPPSPTPTVTKK